MHNGEELFENVVARGRRMIPLLERYLSQEPTLVTQYPQAVRLERTTTVMFLNEALQSLRVQAGARRVARTSVETAPLRQESDALLLMNVRQWKYAPRAHCGAVQANVVVTVDW